MCPFLWGIGAGLIMVPWAHEQKAQTASDLLSRFSTAHSRNQQTDTQTDKTNYNGTNSKRLTQGLCSTWWCSLTCKNKYNGVRRTCKCRQVWEWSLAVPPAEWVWPQRWRHCSVGQSTPLPTPDCMKQARAVYSGSRGQPSDARPRLPAARYASPGRGWFDPCSSESWRSNRARPGRRTGRPWREDARPKAIRHKPTARPSQQTTIEIATRRRASQNFITITWLQDISTNTRRRSHKPKRTSKTSQRRFALGLVGYAACG